ncbi:ClbS/DfsB family four-helix bundle protein [Thalassococcus sp. S3]|uniref:ClbS/DfsB family four-helix bundle protein n=1 Tax=Thalassococcus sp. S3 TaxID=2017482 RepID=UPI001024125C|nr:ClbS/DfsB family four-helix bundle protein [Thalassococcus sp. S3]QBF29972.1 hypothetical protein CFI11_01880 [Thalassococcus sp. S3]
MPAATTKAELHAVTAKEYGKLRKLIDPLPETLALHKFGDDVSIKDVVAHRAHWTRMFFGWVDDGAAAREVHLPAKGYKWNQLKDYNAKLRADQADMTWEEAKSELEATHKTLLERIDTMTEAELYGGPMPGQSKWTTGRFAEASGASHYRSAAKFVRNALKEAKA